MRRTRKKVADINDRKIALVGEWDLLYGGRNRVYEYAPENGVEGINAVWTFEWTSAESLDDMIVEAEQDVEAHTAWLAHLKDLRDSQ
jgi:hypothetical protein